MTCVYSIMSGQRGTFISPAYSKLLIHKSGVQLAFGASWCCHRKQTKDLELGELDTHPTFGFRYQISRHLQQDNTITGLLTRL